MDPTQYGYPGYNFIQNPLFQQGGGMLPPLGQMGQSPLLGGLAPGAQQAAQPHHGGLGAFGPMFGLAGMLGPKAWPYMIGGIGGGMLLSHLFGKHNG